jgi:hypothetical protein
MINGLGEECRKVLRAMKLQIFLFVGKYCRAVSLTASSLSGFPLRTFGWIVKKTVDRII